jgi:peptidoglycan hydrolase CwlO-like protein
MTKTEKKPTSITAEELKSLQELVNALNSAQLEIGGVESRKHNLLHQVVSLQQKLGEIQKSFEETYGKVNVNITDGTISHPEDVEADKED